MRNHAAFSALSALALLSGCMVDGLAARLGEQDPPAIPPPVADATVLAQLPADWAGAQAALHTPPPGSLVLGQETAVGVDGGLSFALPGNQSFSNLLISVRQGQRVRLALVPPVDALTSVYQAGRQVGAADLTAWTGPFNELTTARLLLLLAATAGQPGGMSAVHPRLLQQTLVGLGGGDSRTPAVIKWEASFNRLYVLAAPTGDGPPLLDPATLALDQDFLDANGETGTQAVADLAAAAAEVQIAHCFSPDTIRVVFLVEMKDGMKDGACRAINRWKWAKDVPPNVKSMFLTGGVHEDYVGLAKEQATAISALLGAWQPNALQMYDDGTHGDAVKDDKVWSLAVDLPRLDPPLELGYKHTWGTPGDGWTDCEEWPGNRRMLQLVDVNGDGLVSRYDVFADEASNKDKANQNPKARAGMTWATDLNGDGIPESEEAPADMNDDCTPDGWPPLGTGPALGDLDVQGGCVP